MTSCQPAELTTSSLQHQQHSASSSSLSWWIFLMLYTMSVKTLCKIIFVRTCQIFANFQKLSNDLTHNKLKYGSFSRIISLYNSSFQNCQNFCWKCAPHTWTQVLKTTMLLAGSGINDRPANCACSLIDENSNENLSAVAYF